MVTNKRVAIIAGKYDGCGVSTYLFELQKAINKYIGNCDYYVYDCPSYFTKRDYERMTEKNVKLITRTNASLINDNYDVVFAGYHVVRCQVTEEEARGYYDMFTFDLNKPKTVLVFNEHRPSSILRHYAYNTVNDYCLSLDFLYSFDKIMHFGNNTTTSVFLRDLMGDAEYLKRFAPLYLLYEFDDSKKNWVSAENKIRNITYLGRPALFKDSHRLIRMNKWLQDKNFSVEMRGLGLKSTVENLPDFVYKDNGNYGVDKTKLSDVTVWFDTDKPEIAEQFDVYEMLNIPFNERNGKIYCYGSYDRDEVYKHVNKIMYACDFFNLPHLEDYAYQTCEYCMCEFIDNGIIPVLDYDYGNHCLLMENAELTNTNMIVACMGIFVKKDLSNIDKAILKMESIAADKNSYETFRNKCFESWKKHTDPKAIITKLFNDIYNELH